MSAMLETTSAESPTPVWTPVVEAVTAPPPEAPVIDVTTPVYEPPVYAAGSIESVICSLPWPCGEAVHVARCESNLRPDAINWWTGTALEGDGVFGTFQIALPLHGALMAQYGSWDDPWANAQAAFDLYAGSGYSWYPHWAAACRP